MFARQAWKVLETNLDTVLRQPNNLEARGAMQVGAFLAGTAIENSMLGVCHACANPLTAHYGLTHGLAIGVLLPHVVRFNAAAVSELYHELAEDTELIDPKRNGSGQGAAGAIAGRITELMVVGELPTTLSHCGVDEGILPVLAEEASQQWTARFNPRPVGEADLLAIYRAAL
jgi:alcohol dehydrogenase